MGYKISIIIPVYNAAEFIIKDTLKSIENQTMDFEDIEVILVNDCSSDNTEELLNEYAKEHKNIVPIHLRENAGGPAKPRNIGITYATADYLMFLDQDDTFRENACEVLYNKISSENVDLVCGNYTLVNETTKQKTVCFEYSWAEEEEIKINNIKENPNFLDIGVVVWSKIFRRDFVIKNNLKFVEWIGEDLYFSVRALLLAEGIILLKNFIVVDYLIRDQSLSHQIDKEYLLEYIDIYSGLFEYSNNNISNELFQPLFNSRMRSLLSNLFYANLYFDELSDVFMEIQKLFVNLSKKPFKFENPNHQLFFLALINDEYPFENAILTYAMIKYKQNHSFNNVNKFLTQDSRLYIDCGRGFNEQDTSVYPYKFAEENVFLYDISNFENIKRIRFDPNAGLFVSCEIKKIETNKGELTFKPINSINNESQMNNFLTTDSQYHLFGNLEEIDYIKITLKIRDLNYYEITNLLKE